jgi:hypothetical protein
MYEGAGLGPNDIDIFNPYDGYAPMAQFFLGAFQWHGVKRGDAFAFYAGDIRAEGPHPFCSSGGNLGTGRCRTAMYTDSIEQLRGTAGARQVRLRAETALAAFTTPSNGEVRHAHQGIRERREVRRWPSAKALKQPGSFDLGDHHLCFQARDRAATPEASRSTRNRYWPCWSRVQQAAALRRLAAARSRCCPACGQRPYGRHAAGG